MRTQIKNVSGVCPETDTWRDIDVTFVKVPILGEHGPIYKAIRYSCEYEKEYGCTAAGPSGHNCPLFTSSTQ